VWAYNERTRQTALRPVTHLFRYQRDTAYVLHTATGEALRTTSDHPFYVRGQWVRVKRLCVGDSLVSQRGQRHVLRRIDLKPEHVTVYNFTVDELHTYFVGQNAILVHNCPDVPTTRVRHYTGNKGIDGIEKSGSIKAYDQNKVFAESANKKVLSASDASKRYLIGKNSARNYVEFDVPSSRVKEVTNRLSGKPELTIHGDVELGPASNANYVRRK